MEQTPTAVAAMTIDDCVRMVTACESFADLTNTLPTYAPKFYNRGPVSSVEAIAQRRVVGDFNAWAVRTGRAARAFINTNGVVVS